MRIKSLPAFIIGGTAALGGILWTVFWTLATKYGEWKPSMPRIARPETIIVIPN